MVCKSLTLAALLEASLEIHKNNPNVLSWRIVKRQKQQSDHLKLKHITQDWGLILFVQEGCPWCVRFVPLVKELADESGFQVLAISEKGGPCGPFEGKKDTGLFDHLNPAREAPVLFLLHHSGKALSPIACGLTEGDKIKQNILRVVALHKSKVEERQ